MTAQDQWSRWLLETRFGGDAQAAEAGMRRLYPVRDRVLERAAIREGDTLLDVGTGDGLIALGALDRVGESGRVMFSDISQPLLDHVRGLTEQMAALDRCSFVQASADDLAPIADASVDVVTTRSVLIFVKDKAASFREFHRVLKPGGRVSLFEPINRFNETYEGDRFWYGAEEVADLEARLKDFYRRLQPLDSDPMMDFDEYDLLRACEAAGFRRAHLETSVLVFPAVPAKWDAVINSPGNPNIPSMAEALRQVFTAEEAACFEAHVRPNLERGGRIQRMCVAYLSATKDGE